MLGALILALFVGAAVANRSASAPWILRVLGRTTIVALMALTAWFGGLMTGLIRLGWLLHWLGTPKLEPPWDKIAFFGPAVVVGAAYLLYEMSQPREENR